GGVAAGEDPGGEGVPAVLGTERGPRAVGLLRGPGLIRAGPVDSEVGFGIGMKGDGHDRGTPSAGVLWSVQDPTPSDGGRAILRWEERTAARRAAKDGSGSVSCSRGRALLHPLPRDRRQAPPAPGAPGRSGPRP